ncbi:unnamed protein product, partial [marine sediment metagenome]
GKEDVHAMMCLVESGEMPKNVAEKHGVSTAMVYEYMRRHLVASPFRTVARVVGDEIVAEEYLRGDKMTEIARRYKVSNSAIVRSLTRSNVERRPRDASVGKQIVDGVVHRICSACGKLLPM